jgi:hypothetical protein
LTQPGKLASGHADGYCVSAGAFEATATVIPIANLPLGERVQRERVSFHVPASDEEVIVVLDRLRTRIVRPVTRSFSDAVPAIGGVSGCRNGAAVASWSGLQKTHSL